MEECEVKVSSAFEVSGFQCVVPTAEEISAACLRQIVMLNSIVEWSYRTCHAYEMESRLFRNCRRSESGSMSKMLR